MLASIYSELVVEGVINEDPPTFLFHKPKKKSECYCQEFVLVDKNFTPKEQKIIAESVKNLEYFCNGMIEIYLKFDLDPEDKERITNHNVLLRVDGYHPSIVASDGYLKANTLGLCEYMDNDTRRLYLVMERLTHPTTLRTTSIHEFGHFIGLDHTSKPSIMHKHNNSNVLYPTYKDALEMAHKWDSHPEDFCYFKL